MEHGSPDDDGKPVCPQLARRIDLTSDGSLHIRPGRMSSAVASEHAIPQFPFDDAVLDQPLADGVAGGDGRIFLAIDCDENLSAVTHD